MAALFFFCAGGLAFSQTQAAQQKPAEAQAEQAKPAEYAGSESCQPCHEDIYKAFQRNPHAVVETNPKRGWEGKGCESCHGPGSKHGESASSADILNPGKAVPQSSGRICMTCHLNQSTQVGRVHSGHARNQVACSACHSIHRAGHGTAPRNPAAINEQCGGCHAPVWAQFQKPHAHRLNQGAMSCVDCHNPHGGLLPSSLRTAGGNQPPCFRCHGDKRGPFPFEHPPVRLEGCQACHEPHGSQNPRMLVRHEVREVCLECHANLPVARPAALGVVPPAFHDIRSPRFRNCTICHLKVHGSYVSPTLMR